MCMSQFVNISTFNIITFPSYGSSNFGIIPYIEGTGEALYGVQHWIQKGEVRLAAMPDLSISLRPAGIIEHCPNQKHKQAFRCVYQQLVTR